MTTDYGTDIYCLDSLATGRYARGVRPVAQRCYHRLITPRGTLRGGEHEANFGLDLTALVGGTTEARGSLQQRIANELKKDAEVNTVAVTVDESRDGAEVSWTITIDVVTDAGPFELVLGVDDVSVALLGIAP